MNVAKILITFNVILLLNGHLFASEEESKVEIQKVENRTEAIVTSKQQAKQKINFRWFQKPFIWGEKALVGTARTSSKTMGVITDKSVETVQTGSNFLFSWFFKFLDYKHWRREIQSNR